MANSETMKRFWADQDWKERQLARIAEGTAKGQIEGRYHGAKLCDGHKVGRQIQIAVRIDPEVFDQVKALAVKQGKPLSEIIRTYVEWGLEQEQTSDR